MRKINRGIVNKQNGNVGDWRIRFGSAPMCSITYYGVSREEAMEMAKKVSGGCSLYPRRVNFTGNDHK